MPGADLTFSVLVRPQFEPRQALSGPMAAALGVAAAVAQVSGLQAHVRWPNDLLLGARKVCGILGERAGDALIIGIGLNVNMPDAVARQIDRPATSLLRETGRTFPPGQTLHVVLASLDE